MGRGTSHAHFAAQATEAPMNAAEHYLEGERLLNDGVSFSSGDTTDLVYIAAAHAHFAAAQVAATLAASISGAWFNTYSGCQEMALYRAAIYGREPDDA